MNEKSTAPKDKLNIEIGTILSNRYQIKAFIGSGTYGSVYRATDKKLNIDKALKVFGLKREKKHLIPLLRREAQTLAKLNHPNITRIYDFDEQGEYIFLDMEYVDGENLQEKLVKKKFSPATAARISVALAEALTAAHEQGIIHQDIKPANILMTKDNSPKLSDFGLADNLKDKQDIFMNLGTNKYAAPEKLLGKKADVRADIFSLGISLYELFENAYPFKIGKSGLPHHELPAPLRDNDYLPYTAISKCLSEHPDDRFASAKDLILELSKLNQNEAITQKMSHFVEVIGLARLIPAKNDKYAKLLAALIVLLIIFLPFSYFIILEEMGKIRAVEREIPINPPDGTQVYKNFEKQASLDGKYRVKQNDFLQYLDSKGTSQLDMFYENQDSLSISMTSSEIFVNKQLYGRIIANDTDLPIEKSIKFLRLDMLVRPAELNGLGAISVQISDDASLLLGKLPATTRCLNISHTSIKNLSNCHHLKNLQVLVASNVRDLQFSKIPTFKELKSLDIRNTQLSRLIFVRPYKQLKNLLIDNNRLVDLKAINRYPLLESVSMSNNPLTDPSELQKLNHLQSVAGLENTDQLVKLAEKLATNIVRDKKDANYLWLYICGAFILVLLAGICYYLIKVINAGNARVALIKVNTALTSKTEKIMHNLKKILLTQELFKANGRGAFDIYTDLKKETSDALLIKQATRLLKLAILKKIARHKKHNEYEAIYVCANKSSKYLQNKQVIAWQDKAKKMLQKNDIEPRYLKIKGGSYTMGDFTHTDLKLFPHHVNISDFYLAETLITNRQFCEFINKNGNKKENGVEWLRRAGEYSKIREQDGVYIVEDGYEAFPAYDVSWYGALQYALAQKGRLVTEAEWEYVARNMGKNIIYTSGDTISGKDAKFFGDSHKNEWKSTFPVMSCPANKLGIYDLAGNLYEWCLDIYEDDYYQNSPADNPNGPRFNPKLLAKEVRVIRGGSWISKKDELRTYHRANAKATSRNNLIGFRVAKDYQ